MKLVASLAASLAFAGLGMSACRHGSQSDGTGAVAFPDTAVRHRDVVVDQALYGAFDPRTAPHTCGDETRDSLVLAAGERRSFQVPLEGATKVSFGGCVEDAETEISARLRWRAIGARGEAADFSVALSGPPAGNSTTRWRKGEFDLGSFGGERTLSFEVAFEGAPGAKAYVDTLAFRSTVGAERPRPAPRAILISLDAFREDALGAVGGRSATPTLDRLLAESERFTPSWSQEISTKTSHAAMLTGLPVDLHGVDREERPLRPEIETLAERLRAAGASTGAFMQIAPFFAEKFALNQGFDTYRLKAWTTAQELRLAADWSAEKRDESSLLFVHLYGAHSDFATLPYESTRANRATVAERFGIENYGCVGEVCASRRLLAINYRALAPLPRESEITRWLYDRGVEDLDQELGRFFDELRRAGLWDETLVVVTGDHGEAFGEHGYFLHTSPHEEALRVPLIVKWPRSLGRAGRVTPRFATALDIAPTILRHFGLPAADLPGHDLAEPPGRGARLMLSKDAVRVDDLKLILATPEFPRALYDLAADPAESRNLLPAREADAARLEEMRRLALAAAARRLNLSGESEVDSKPFTDEERERLRSLGYL